MPTYIRTLATTSRTCAHPHSQATSPPASSQQPSCAIPTHAHPLTPPLSATADLVRHQVQPTAVTRVLMITSTISTSTLPWHSISSRNSRLWLVRIHIPTPQERGMESGGVTAHTKTLAYMAMQVRTELHMVSGIARLPLPHMVAQVCMGVQ